jgi:plastocyanin
VKKAFAITAASAVSNVSVSSFSPTAGARRDVDEVSFKAASAMPWENECDYYYYDYYFGCGHFVELTAPAGTEFSSNADDYLFTDGVTSGFAYYYADVDPEGAGDNVVRVDLPYEMSVAAGDTVHLTVFGVTNPAGAVPAGELAVSTAADAKPVAKPFAIAAASAVSSVSVSTSNAAAGASGVVDTASFKASHAITSGEVDGNCCGEPGYVRLMAPAGSEFEGDYYYYRYTVTDGSASAEASVEVDPEDLGQNVVDVFIPQDVPVKAGDTIQVVARGVRNPSSAVPSGEFAVSTSSDATAVKKAFAITAASAVSL